MFNKILIIIFLVINPVIGQNPVNLLMPTPMEYRFNDERFMINPDLNIAVLGHPNARIYGSATRMLQRLKDRTGVFFTQFLVTDQNSGGDMTIEVKRPGVNILKEDESYELEVTSSSVKIKAETDLGAMHGLETLLQSLQSDCNGYFFPGCNITDSPRFPWRGLMIDVSRHFMPVDVIKHNIDGMAAVKMNVFHFHISDDQGFRIECKTFPKLHQLGSDGLYFTQEQIKDIIAYADDRGIRVVPEFDIPGHTSSWFVGYPELASGNGPYNIARTFGILLPAINPIKEETYQFLDAFFKEMAALFPDAYMHIGGDENNGKEWDANPSIKIFKTAHKLADNDALQAYFNKRVVAILTKHGKKVIGWDEIKNPQLPKDIIIQSWRGRQGLIDAAQNGYQTILSNGYYIDLVQSAEFHYLNDPLPANIPLSEQQKNLVLGGEATMWNELATWENVDSRIWPRTAAIAERLWSPASVVNVPLMYDKLERISVQLEELGLTHEKNYDMMLRRLVGNTDVAVLKNLVDVLEPIKLYQRVRAREVSYTTYSPYSRVVDAARPDAVIARHFNTMVDQYLKNPNEKEAASAITNYLNLWASNHELLKPIIQRRPQLKEVETLSADLAAIAKIGLEALNFIGKNHNAPKAWHDNSIQKIKHAGNPRGQAEIAVIKGIQELVNSVKYAN